MAQFTKPELSCSILKVKNIIYTLVMTFTAFSIINMPNMLSEAHRILAFSMVIAFATIAMFVILGWKLKQEHRL